MIMSFYTRLGTGRGNFFYPLAVRMPFRRNLHRGGIGYLSAEQIEVFVAYRATIVCLRSALCTGCGNFRHQGKRMTCGNGDLDFFPVGIEMLFATRAGFVRPCSVCRTRCGDFVDPLAVGMPERFQNEDFDFVHIFVKKN